jgi:hypothetical protein
MCSGPPPVFGFATLLANRLTSVASKSNSAAALSMLTSSSAVSAAPPPIPPWPTEVLAPRRCGPRAPVARRQRPARPVGHGPLGSCPAHVGVVWLSPMRSPVWWRSCSTSGDLRGWVRLDDGDRHTTLCHTQPGRRRPPVASSLERGDAVVTPPARPTSPQDQTRHTSCIPAPSEPEVAEGGATFLA